MTVTVTTKAGERVAFLVEAKRAGIFEDPQRARRARCRAAAERGVPNHLSVSVVQRRRHRAAFRLSADYIWRRSTRALYQRLRQEQQEQPRVHVPNWQPLEAHRQGPRSSPAYIPRTMEG